MRWDLGNKPALVWNQLTKHSELWPDHAWPNLLVGGPVLWGHHVLCHFRTDHDDCQLGGRRYERLRLVNLNTKGMPTTLHKKTLGGPQKVSVVFLYIYLSIETKLRSF